MHEVRMASHQSIVGIACCARLYAGAPTDALPVKALQAIVQAGR